MANCNECKHINVTEQEYHSGKNRAPHICTKYLKRLYHGNQHKGLDDNINPCRECQEDYNKAFAQR